MDDQCLIAGTFFQVGKEMELQIKVQSGYEFQSQQTVSRACTINI